jgi:hypothetical protein
MQGLRILIRTYTQPGSLMEAAKGTDVFLIECCPAEATWFEQRGWVVDISCRVLCVTFNEIFDAYPVHVISDRHLILSQSSQ